MAHLAHRGSSFFSDKKEGPRAAYDAAVNAYLDAFDAAATAYLEASRQLTGTIGDDFGRAWAECERLRQACRSAHKLVLAHFGSER